MATLVSPGVSISVIDQSINVGAGPGTVPLIFIATQQDKSTPDGTDIAPGTTAANAGVVWSITSQRDLVQTFGDPIFYSVSGTSLNGYPLNEYGLLSAYSYLGLSNLVRVVRANINTTELEPTPIEPTSPERIGLMNPQVVRHLAYLLASGYFQMKFGPRLLQILSIISQQVHQMFR